MSMFDDEDFGKDDWDGRRRSRRPPRAGAAHVAVAAPAAAAPAEPPAAADQPHDELHHGLNQVVLRDGEP